MLSARPRSPRPGIAAGQGCEPGYHFRLLRKHAGYARYDRPVLSEPHNAAARPGRDSGQHDDQAIALAPGTWYLTAAGLAAGDPGCYRPPIRRPPGCSMAQRMAWLPSGNRCRISETPWPSGIQSSGSGW